MNCVHPQILTLYYTLCYNAETPNDDSAPNLSPCMSEELIPLLPIAAFIRSSEPTIPVPPARALLSQMTWSMLVQAGRCAHVGCPFLDADAELPSSLPFVCSFNSSIEKFCVMLEILSLRRLLSCESLTSSCLGRGGNLGAGASFCSSARANAATSSSFFFSLPHTAAPI